MKKKKRKEKEQEHETWWTNAKIRKEMEEYNENKKSSNTNRGDEENKKSTSRIIQAYQTRDANDYSTWKNWKPNDPVTLAEEKEKEEQLNEIRNQEFEKRNAEFCQMFKKDLEDREEATKKKEKNAQKLKEHGNLCFKRKDYNQAIDHYMKALEDAPTNTAILSNIGQAFLKLEKDVDALEFFNRVLYVDPFHVKALSRRAFIFIRQGKTENALKDLTKAKESAPENVDVAKEYNSLVRRIEDDLCEEELASKMAAMEDNSYLMHPNDYELLQLNCVMNRMRIILHADSNADNQKDDHNPSQAFNNKMMSKEGINDKKYLTQVVIDEMSKIKSLEEILADLLNSKDASTYFRLHRGIDWVCSDISERLRQFSEPDHQNDDQDNVDSLVRLINVLIKSTENDIRNQETLFSYWDSVEKILSAPNEEVKAAGWNLVSRLNVIDFLSAKLNEEILKRFSSTLVNEIKRSKQVKNMEICCKLLSSFLQKRNFLGQIFSLEKEINIDLFMVLVDNHCAITKSKLVNYLYRKSILESLFLLSTNRNVLQRFEDYNENQIECICNAVCPMIFSMDGDSLENSLSLLLNISFVDRQRILTCVWSNYAQTYKETFLCYAHKYKSFALDVIMERWLALTRRLLVVQECLPWFYSENFYASLHDILKINPSKSLSKAVSFWTAKEHVLYILAILLKKKTAVYEYLLQNDRLKHMFESLEFPTEYMNGRNNILEVNDKTRWIKQTGFVANLVQCYILYCTQSEYPFNYCCQIFNTKLHITKLVFILKETKMQAQHNTAILLAKLCRNKDIKEKVANEGGMKILLTLSQEITGK